MPGVSSSSLPSSMAIIHGRQSRTPFSLGGEMIAKLSVIADYYQIHEAVWFQAERWIKEHAMSRVQWAMAAAWDI